MISNTDYIGIENVAKAIELSKLTKFTISRANANGHYTPIFDCLDSDSNTTAVEQFNEIAKILNICTATFNYKFKKIYNMTPYAYSQQLK